MNKQTSLILPRSLIVSKRCDWGCMDRSYAFGLARWPMHFCLRRGRGLGPREPECGQCSQPRGSAVPVLRA